MTWQAYQEFMQAMRVRIAEKASQGLQSGRGVEVNDRVITLDPVIRAAPAVERPVITNVLFADITVTQAVGQIKVKPPFYEPFNGAIPYGLSNVLSWYDLTELAGYEAEVGRDPFVPLLVYGGDYVADLDNIPPTPDLWISPLTRSARIRFYVRGFIGAGRDFEDGINVGTFRVRLQQRGTVVSGIDLLKVTKDHEITVGWQGTDLEIESIAETDSSQTLYVMEVANS
jgi:hypothetical protein